MGNGAYPSGEVCVRNYLTIINTVKTMNTVTKPIYYVIATNHNPRTHRVITRKCTAHLNPQAAQLKAAEIGGYVASKPIPTVCNGAMLQFYQQRDLNTLRAYGY